MSTTLQVYTLAHVLISLAGIASGFVVMAGLSRSRLSPWTKFFLSTTALTSLTGFGFPIHGVTPGHVLGVLSLIALGAAAEALNRPHFTGRWSKAFVAGSFLAQYFNVFVLIVQSFQKVPALHALAPTQTKWPFAAVQLLTLVAFIAWGLQAARRFQPVATNASQPFAPATSRQVAFRRQDGE
jgi:hypothetical protein